MRRRNRAGLILVTLALAALLLWPTALLWPHYLAWITGLAGVGRLFYAVALIGGLCE